MFIILVVLVFDYFYVICIFCFFKQKTAYEMRISDWSSDVCSSDLLLLGGDGSDTLSAGDGRTILIGGNGVDLLNGGAADDLLIGGRTSFDDEIGRASCRERVCQYV